MFSGGRHPQKSGSDYSKCSHSLRRQAEAELCSSQLFVRRNPQVSHHEDDFQPRRRHFGQVDGNNKIVKNTVYKKKKHNKRISEVWFYFHLLPFSPNKMTNLTKKYSV